MRKKVGRFGFLRYFCVRIHNSSPYHIFYSFKNNHAYRLNITLYNNI